MVIRLWRKYGAWYWAILEDSARKMLNMMEWWLCLAIESDEGEHVGRFRELMTAQPAVLLSAHREPRKYTDSLLLAGHFQALLRIPAPAARHDEREEKAERLRIMSERRCTPREAAYVIARRLPEGPVTIPKLPGAI